MMKFYMTIRIRKIYFVQIQTDANVVCLRNDPNKIEREKFIYVEMKEKSTQQPAYCKITHTHIIHEY